MDDGVRQIFLSYASSDGEAAQRFVGAFEARGWSVWWDHAIPAGERFDQVIEKELEKSQCVVVLWSKASVDRHWVRTEAGEGLQRGALVPVLIDDVKIPLEFRRIQAANLIDWTGEATHPEFERLCRDIEKNLRRDGLPSNSQAPVHRPHLEAAAEETVVSDPHGRASPSLMDLGGIRETIGRVIEGGGLVVAGVTDIRRGTKFMGELAFSFDAVHRIVAGIGFPSNELPEGALPFVVNDAVSFHQAFAAVKHHDVDFVISDRVRDKSGAELALRCAEDGVGVIAHVSASSAAEGVSFLLDLGLEPARLSHVLKLVVYQHPLRLKGRSEILLYEFVEVGRAVKRAVARRAEPAKLESAMVECGLRSFSELTRVVLQAGGSPDRSSMP